MAKLELLQSFSGHNGEVNSLSWHPILNVFASCGEDKTIKLWSKEGQTWIKASVLVDEDQRPIKEVSWSPCGRFLASANYDATFWDKKNGHFDPISLEGHGGEVTSVAWQWSGEYLASCGRDKSLWFYEEDGDAEYSNINSKLSLDVKKIVWHPCQSILAAASYDNTVKICKQNQHNDWACVATLRSHESIVRSLTFDKTGARLATCSDDRTVKIWKEDTAPKALNNEEVDVSDKGQSWKCISTLLGYHNSRVCDIAWCHRTGLLATADGDGIIRIFKETEGSDYNSPTFELACTKNAHSLGVTCVKWHPIIMGELLSCSNDGEIKVWKFLEEP